MKQKRIFLSSVQKEFAAERAALRDYLLAEPLYLTKYIERMGTGTRDMIRRCREAGLKEPEFRVTDGFSLTIPRLPVTVTKMPVAGLGEKLGETRAAIVKAMQDNPKVTVTKLANILRISTTAVEKNIQYLKSEGYVERIGAAKGGHWEILK